MEEPAFLREAGDLAGLHILDLGCGDGTFGLTAQAAGCASYTGVDGSSVMIERARRTLADTSATVVHGDIEDLGTGDLGTADPGSAGLGTADLDGRFDLVASRLALHYIEDLAPVMTTARSMLRPDGRFVITVVHPVISSHDDGVDGLRTSWTVDDYFRAGARQRQWFGATVTWYHRPVEHYTAALTNAGFDLIALSEAAPVPELFGDAVDEFERRSRVPLFLVLHARRSSRP